MAFSLHCTSLSSSSLSPSSRHHLNRRPLYAITIHSRSRIRPPLRASRKFPNYPHEAVAVVRDPPAWARDLGGAVDQDDDDDDEEDEEGDDRSLDLLARFLHNLFRKISRRARKAARSLLPPSIPTKLVGFSVNGVLVLGFLWILKALLEVVCTVASMVFVSILLVRGIWSGISYIKEQQYYDHLTRMDTHSNTWNGVQPTS